jgi:hypothetical protein
MWAGLVAFFQGIKSFDDLVKRLQSIFTKTPQEKAEKVASDAQADQNSIDKTGRPL